jgi:hypothetical protein
MMHPLIKNKDFLDGKRVPDAIKIVGNVLILAKVA